MRTRFLGLSLVLALAFGCDGDPDPTDASVTPDSGTVTDAGETPDTGPPPSDAGTDAGPTPDAGPVDGGGTPDVVVRSHPCPGVNRTDALWVDPDGTIYLGCGSGADGDGMFVSADEGQTWAIPDTNPANLLTSFRVLSIHRGFGGLLYVAGEGTASSAVISLDTSSTPFAAAAVLTRGTTVSTAFQPGPFVTTASGAAFADSFMGFSALYRPNDSVGDTATDWTDAGDWETEGSYQIRDLVVQGENFVGCGSTIAQPPVVFLPSQETDPEPWEMTPVVLVSGLGAWTGEMWGVAANADRVVAVGVDQDNDVGKIFVSGADRYAAGDYTQTDIDPLLPDRVSGSDSTWARGVCMDGDRVVVVGEIQPLGSGDNTGFVLESTDGGATFSDITPDGSPNTWSKCQIMDSGRVVVAGASAVGLLD